MASENYDRHREAAAGRQSEQSRQGRDVGPLPKVQDPQRKKRCRTNLKLFLGSYFPRAFPKPWSGDHLTALKKAETAVLKGGFFALAMPRGSGKTTICERAVIWAVAYGHHPYAVLICADEGKAVKSLEKIKVELETNPQLAEDFPEICHPIRSLERIANRAKGQLCDGEPTRLVWEKKKLVLPTIAGAASSGAILEVGGITGAIRGAAHVLPTGEVIRPTIGLIDDPQTRESAKSEVQSEDREDIVNSDIRGMAGPGEKFSALMPCTVIRNGDMADRMLNRKLHPEWHGERMKLLYRFPDRMDLWAKYHEILSDELENDGDGSRATQFYADHREEMDLGAKVGWADRYEEGELSAVQNAMNLYLLNPRGFASEYQNEPDEGQDDDDDLLAAEDIPFKVHPQNQGLVPLAATRLTAFVDCHKRLLYYAVVAFEDDFTGYVVDYGTFPEQKRSYFSMRDARPTLMQKFPGSGEEGALRKGLDALKAELVDREWKQEGGGRLSIGQMLVDAGWRDDVVKQFCREVGGSVILPSFGRYVGAKSNPFSEMARRPGETVGNHWRRRKDKTHKVRYVIYDSNYWKSFFHARLSTSIGDPGSVSLFQARPNKHRMIADHMRAEDRVKVEANGRQVDEWQLPAQKPDNHLFDCVVGACVAASIDGARLPSLKPVKQKKTSKRKKFSEIRREKGRR